MTGPGNHTDYPLLLWPAAASHAATHVDYLISAFTAVTLLLTVPIFLAITYFALVYRAGRKFDRGHTADRNVKVEMSWMLIPFFLTLAFFVWGAQIFDVSQHAPANAMTIQGIGRQWMWKFEHPGGQAEINDLHVPTGQPIVINMISQDVIHSLYLPAFRVQMETWPGRYTQVWFKADRPGAYRMYCSEYCGTDHSVMDGQIYVMTPDDYEHWLNWQDRACRWLRAARGCSPASVAPAATVPRQPCVRRRWTGFTACRCRFSPVAR